MTRQEIYQIWAPTESEWSQWVKPVLFAHLPEHGSFTSSIAPPEDSIALPVPSNDGETALVLDLPGAMAAQIVGDVLRQRYRPVPLYNSCPPPKSWAAPNAGEGLPLRRLAVDVQPMMDAIVATAPLLKAAGLPPDARPAFLLDAKRRIAQAGYVSEPGAFDNRSVSLPTDFPSSNFLLSRKIRKIVVISQDTLLPQADLSHTLLRWQRAGISIAGVTLASEGAVSVPRPITVRRPPYFRIAWYAFMERFGLRPNLLGGFGGVLPESGGVG
jgi:hypothetical protein